MPLEQSSFSARNPARADIVCFGDSHTYNSTYNNGDYSLFYPSVAQASLRAGGYNVGLINQGVSGDKSDQVLTRVNAYPASARPLGAIIYVGTNDWVAGVQTMDTTANIVAAGNKLIALGYTHLVVGLQHYLNFSTGGDTLGAQQVTAAATRAAQQAAATTLGATVADFYTYMRNLIVAGTDTQGSASWHIADSNTHLNAYGESLLAKCVQSVIPLSWLPTS